MSQQDPLLRDGAASGAEQYPVLRKTGLVLLGIIALFTVVYYRLDLLPMAAHTVIPFFWLLVIGFVLGLVFRKGLFVPCFIAWWLVLIAVMLRRMSMSTVPLASQLFGGALMGYPSWAVRFSQFLRLGVYFWALWLGGRLAYRLRRKAPAVPGGAE